MRCIDRVIRVVRHHPRKSCEQFGLRPAGAERCTRSAVSCPSLLPQFTDPERGNVLVQALPQGFARDRGAALLDRCGAGGLVVRMATDARRWSWAISPMVEGCGLDRVAERAQRH